jgi:hypothetical protein
MGYTVAAIEALVGNPIAAAAKGGTSEVTLLRGDLDEVMERWQGAWLVAGGALLVATILMSWARISRAGLDLRLDCRLVSSFLPRIGAR